MPIDYSKYPSDWKTRIRPEILERAEYCCENCGIRDREFICRSTRNKARYEILAINEQYHSFASSYKSRWSKPIYIVLTISHTDHDIKNNDYSNLRALCQRCHFWHDKDHHAETRKRNHHAN